MSSTIACKHHFTYGCKNPHCKFAHTKQEYNGSLPWDKAIQQAIYAYENYKRTPKYQPIKLKEEHKLWNDTERKKCPCRWELTTGCKTDKHKCPFAHDKYEFRGIGWETSCQKVLMEYYKFKLEQGGKTKNAKGAYIGSEFCKINHNLTLETRKYANFN